MNNTCNCSGKCANPHVGMLLLRIATGAVFALHGYQKFQNLAGTRAFFVTLHLFPWLATFVAGLELIGGIAIILGLWTCFFSPLLAIDMAVAIVLSTFPHGGFKGSELEIMLLASALTLKHVGAGRWKLGRGCGCLICKNRENTVQ
ncbi:MAG: oxidoreductase [Parcubacteria group bacterium]|nr:oxidoreductase [Parcubacteria group bacterium]